MLNTSTIRSQLATTLNNLNGLLNDVSPDRLTAAESENLTSGIKRVYIEFNGADIEPISIGPTRGFEVTESWDVIILLKYWTGDDNELTNGVEDAVDSNVAAILRLLDDRTLSGACDNIEPSRVEYDVNADGEYMTVRGNISFNIIYRTTKTD